MNPEKLLAKVRTNPRDVRFSDLVALAEALGERALRQRCSHRMFRHPKVPEALNIQPESNGKAKGYQVRQFLRYVDRFDLSFEDEP